MKKRPTFRLLALACAAVFAATAAAQRSDCIDWHDPIDATVRRTDPGNDGVLNPASTVPELLRLSICAWEPYDPEGDPYSGEVVDSRMAHIFRLDLHFDGLVNPPGPLGLGGDVFDPFRFGVNPVVGFVELDVDDEKDTGGELGGAAELRYLANVARFARIPDNSAGERAARDRHDIDGDFDSSPQYERSGADFSLVLCGCFTPTVQSLEGDGDGLFEEGETWLVFGRFFERSQGYRDASAAYGGSGPGLYDPIVELRFMHDQALDLTTVTLVWALDQAGAAALAGEPEEVMDLDVSNHASIQEAIQDVIDGANAGGIYGPPWELVRHWRGRESDEYLDVDDWGQASALLGMPYAEREAALYAWTDTLGDEYFADVNGDGYVDSVDQGLVRAAVYDADGGDDGVFELPNPGWNFSVYDTDGNMRLDLYDQQPYGPLGDFDGSGTVNTQDFIAFLNAWAAKLPSSDFNLDQRVDTLDFIAFLNAWVSG